MKTFTHHPDDSTVLTYGAGALGEGFSLVLAAHMETCTRCRSRLAEAETLGGELLSELQPVQMESGDLSGFWDRVEAMSPVEPVEKVEKPLTQGVPAVLSPYLDGDLDTIDWRNLVPGVRQHVIEGIDSGNGSVRLLSIAPGTTIPHHTHDGSELTLVLRGSYTDEIGHFQPGDLADLDPSVHHRPVADGKEPCICLIATDERLRFSGFLSRVIQPLIGI
jgi:putative transcriptional regulator